MIILVIIGLVLAIGIPNVLYKWILKGETRTITNKEFAVTLLLASTLYMIPIIIIQVSVDHFLHLDNYAEITTFREGFLISFFRAAFLEEGTKLFFTYRILKRHQNLGMKETVLLAGVIGIGHGILEKLVLGGAALAANAIFPGHLLFQWIMGYYIFRAKRAEGTQRRKLFACCYLVPFVVHGLWDFGLYIGEVLMEKPGTAMDLAGIGVIGLMVIIYAVTLVKAAKTVKRIEG